MSVSKRPIVSRSYWNIAMEKSQVVLSRRVLRTAFAIAVVCVSWLPAAGAAGNEADLNVMSFNIRYSYGKPQEEASENDWRDARHPRRERVVRVIRENPPDILGVQEARHLQIEDLRAALPDFDFYGIGRDDGKTEGEYSGIFYLRDRFKQLEARSFWLSATPEKPGTTFYTARDAVPRIASWVRLADNQSGREIFVLNMHWDHISVPAREQSGRLVRTRLTELAEGLPAIVMGDLNAPEDSKAVTELVGTKGAAGRRLLDSFRAMHPKRTPEESTFSAWNGRTEGSRIDFILHTDELRPTAASIVRTSYDGFWPSDHYPVTATLRLGVK
jgi:endonuclease/exonuclease/phosphatase family metal-dependent hydrolase